MLVTKWNQSVVLPDFKAALASSEFCAFDEEMTGVDCASLPLTFGDMPEKLYESRRAATEMFNAFQFGIALFVRNPSDENRFDVLPYNFFLLKTDGDVRLDLRVIPFHNSNAMDFQKWLTFGMCYCTAREEAELRKGVEAVRPLSTELDRKSFDKIVAAVETWYSASAAETLNEAGDAAAPTTSLVISEPCSYAVAKAVKHYVTVTRDIPVTVHYDGKPYFGENMVFVFEKIEREAWETMRANQQQDADRKLSSLLGFREYWNAIVESKKPMVGHNCFQDLLFMIHMHEEALPRTYHEFKAITHKTFPTIYDTKTLAASLTGERGFAQTHLGGVYTEVRRRFNCSHADGLRSIFRLPPGFYDYDEAVMKGGGKAHEAGYDAYMTGICFHFLRKLHENQLLPYENVISAFGSIFFCCIAENVDKLAVPSTFMISSDTPFHLEQLEALLFTSESREKITINGKVDARKLNYRANSVQKDELGMCITACVVFSSEETVESVTQKLNQQFADCKAENVHRDLAKRLCVSVAHHT